MAYQSTGTCAANVPGNRPMVIVVVNLHAARSALTTNFRSVRLRYGDIVNMVIPQDVTTTPPAINHSSKFVPASIVEAVVLDENKLLATVIWRLGP